MKKEDEILPTKQVYYRLIALWVLCEAFLGGIIHGFKIPVSGLVVGSGAIICICLIAYYVPLKGAIIKATIVVAIFKMMLSPHSPPAAYLAVFFQGCLGQLIFSGTRYFKVSCIIFGMLSMIESACQRVLALLIIYGTGFWEAVNLFITRLTGQQEVTNYSVILAAGYITLHAIAGLFVGWMAGQIATKLQNWTHRENLILDEFTSAEKFRKPGSHRSRKRIIKIFFSITWLFLLIIFLQSYFQIGEPLLPAHQSIQILLRSVLILLTWYLLLSPIVLFLMKRWLNRQKSRSQSDVQEVLLLLPSMQQLIKQSWRLAGGNSRWSRIKNSLKIVLVNALHNRA